MRRIFFTADLHLEHANIIKYANRPFLLEGDLIGNGELSKRVWKSQEIKEKRCSWMNETLVNNWNNKVNKEDVVYHVGDFCFKGNGAFFWEQKLNGTIVHILGNHDRNNSVKSCLVKGIMEFGNKTILVQHHPPKSEFDIPLGVDMVLCGHVHDEWKFKVINDIPIINVGVDVWGLEPVPMNSILKFYNKIKLGRAKQ